MIDQSEVSYIDQSEASLLTMIVHREAGQDGDAKAARGGEDGELVLRHRRLEGRSSLGPIRDELVEGPRLETGSGQDVASD